MKTEEVTRDEVLFMIQDAGSRFFRVIFTKRTTGETRKMLCQRGVKRHLAGGSRAYDPAEKKLIFVHDKEIARKEPKKAYRSIPVEGIISVVFGGTEYKVKEGT